MKKQDFFVKFLSLVAFQLRAPAHWATPLATPMILRQDRALKFFHKKKHLKQNQKKLFFQNVEDSSQVT